MIWWRLFVYFLAFNYVFGFEMLAPFTAINSLLARHNNCRLYECCGPGWIFFNDTGRISDFFSLAHNIYHQKDA